ncbi:MAG: DUF4331 family protein, partial [Sciscionella sp.]
MASSTSMENCGLEDTSAHASDMQVPDERSTRCSLLGCLSTDGSTIGPEGPAGNAPDPGAFAPEHRSRRPSRPGPNSADLEWMYGLFAERLGWPPAHDREGDRQCRTISPADAERTVLILNANPQADALHPDAIYRLAIDNDGDLLNDMAFSWVFAAPNNGEQNFSVFLAKGAEARSVEAVGTQVVTEAKVSFGPEPNIVKSGDYTFFAGARSDAFCFDYDGIKNLYDTRGGRNFTAPHLGGKSPWTGKDSNTEANVFSTVVELPTAELGADPDIRIWGRCSLRRDGKLLHVDRAGHPSVSSF